MAKHQSSWTDYVQLIITILLVTGLVAGAVFLVRTIRETVESTKANLKAKGYHVTDNGIHIKTDKRMDRESYMDATQRGFINGMEAIKKAGSFRNAADEEQKRQQELKAAGKSAPLHGEKEKGSRFNFRRKATS